jgi:hypothetical protein
MAEGAHPVRAAGRSHPIGVQRLGDPREAEPAGAELEDAPHDRGLVGIHHAHHVQPSTRPVAAVLGDLDVVV